MSKFLELEAKCPCGKDGRYFNVDKHGNEGMSCNKHIMCPTYDELEQTYKELLFNYGELLDAAGDAVIFREGTDLYKDAEKVISKHIEVQKKVCK